MGRVEKLLWITIISYSRTRTDGDNVERLPIGCGKKIRVKSGKLSLFPHPQLLLMLTAVYISLFFSLREKGKEI